MTNPPSERIRLPLNVYLLAATSFLTDVSSEMLSNILPLFLVNVLGARTAVVGLIDGIAETTASLVKIISGELSDRLGSRKPLTVAGYSLSTLAKPFLYFATSWSWVLGVRFADRVGKGIRTAPRDALLAGSVAPQQRGLAFGLHRAGDTAGAFVGLGIYYASTEGVAKALVADLVHQEQRGAAYGYYNASIGLTALPASLIAGILWQGMGGWWGFGAAAPFFFGAALALAAGLLFYWWVK